jgi:predicted methyltransferase
VLATVGLAPGMDAVDLCSGDGWFTLQGLTGTGAAKSRPV